MSAEQQKKCCLIISFLLFVLLFPAGILCDGLPGEFLLSSRWRDLMWYHSPLSNPAFLTETSNITFRAAVSPVLQGAFTLGEMGLTVPILLNHIAGVSLIGEYDGKVQSARFDETSNRLVTGENEISNKNFYGMLSYALIPWKNLSAGVNFALAHQTNFGEPQTGVGLDFGFSWKLVSSDSSRSHLLGISTVNLISPSVGSDDGSYSRDIKASWAGCFLNKSLEAGLDLDLRDFWARVEDFKADGDLRSAGKDLEWGLSTRAGYWILNTFAIFGQLGFDERGVEYWGLAGGIRIPLKKNLGTITSFYQYNIKTEGSLASSHTIYLLWSFGKSRKEMWKKQITDTTQTDLLSKLKEIRGLKVEEEKEYIRITATQIAVNFASGSADLPPDAIPVLKEIVAFLKTYPNHPVLIEGHTDNDPIIGKLREKFQDNTALSQARCQAVKDYFVKTENLPEELFTAIGYGESRPLVPNDSRENKRINRRVLVIVKK
jgi:flagellar motor protein MotB